MPSSSGKRHKSDFGGPRKAGKLRSSSRSRGVDEEETVMWSQDSPIRDKAKSSQFPMRDSMKGYHYLIIRRPCLRGARSLGREEER